MLLYYYMNTIYILYYSNYFFMIIFGSWNQKLSITSLFYNIHQCLPLPQSKPNLLLGGGNFQRDTLYKRMKNRPAKIKLVCCQSIHRAVTPLPPSLTGKWGKKYVSKKKKEEKERKERK